MYVKCDSATFCVAFENCGQNGQKIGYIAKCAT